MEWDQRESPHPRNAMPDYFPPFTYRNYFFLPSPTSSSEEPSLYAGVMETQQFLYIPEGCNHGLGQPTKAGLQSPQQRDSSKDGPTWVSKVCFQSKYISQ